LSEDSPLSIVALYSTVETDDREIGRPTLFFIAPHTLEHAPHWLQHSPCCTTVLDLSTSIMYAL
jgi:hypothetical protein